MMRKERIIYLSFIVVIFVTAITLSRNEKSVRTIENKRYWISKTYSNETFPLVMGGDSRVFRGLSPEAFKNEWPRMTGVNLGYSSNGFHPQYMDFLEERLDMNAEQPIILLGISAHSFSRNGSGSYAFRAEVKRNKEEVMQYMNFYRLTKLFAPLSILETLGLAKKNNFMENFHRKFHADGWTESDWVRRDTSYSIPSYKVIFTDNQYNEDAAGMFFRKVKEWDEKGILVLAFRSPTTHGIRVLEDSLSGFKIESFRKEFLENGGLWIEVDRRDYKTYDGNHVESESALKLSADLARKMREIIE